MTFLFTAALALLAIPALADSAADAQHELYAARYEHAAQLYREALKQNPQWAEGYDGLVRALLESHQSAEAFAAADSATEHVPGTAACLVANGRAFFRKGEISQAEKAWRDALAMDPKNAPALERLARTQAVVAHYKIAERYIGMAHRLAPEDPLITVAFANSLKGAAHLEALRTALAVYDPDSREAKSLRAHISSDEALGDVKIQTLKSGYHSYEIKLVELLDGPRRIRGLGVRVSFNGERPVTLLLDTGASGISLAPRLAEKFQLRQLGTEGSEFLGVGDKKSRSLYRFLAGSVRIGDTEFENYPIAVFDTARMPEADGLIGADVFARFLVTVDFPNRLLTLAPFNKKPPDEQEGAEDASPRPEGLFPIYRFRHLLLVPTFVNKDEQPHLFLADSGASSNVIDAATAHGSTKTHTDTRTYVKGVQGTVKNVARVDEGTLTFAGFRQQNPDLLALDLTRQSDDIATAIGGFLGFEVLRNLKMTIDCRDAAVRFERSAR